LIDRKCNPVRNDSEICEVDEEGRLIRDQWRQYIRCMDFNDDQAHMNVLRGDIVKEITEQNYLHGRAHD